MARSPMDFIPYATQSINEDDLAAVREVLTSGWLTQGPAVPRFEQAFAQVASEWLDAATLTRRIATSGGDRRRGRGGRGRGRRGPSAGGGSTPLPIPKMRVAISRPGCRTNCSIRLAGS